MAGRKDPGSSVASDPASAGSSAVERSLEEFIARANSTLPVGPRTGDEADTSPRSLVAEVKRRRKTDAPRPGAHGPTSTLVVLGSQTPLAEVTQIVNRVPARPAPAARRGVLGLRLGVAFFAGAGAVLLVSRLLIGGPQPQRPSAPATAAVALAPAPVVTPAPVPVVEPMPAPTPTVTEVPVAAAAAGLAVAPREPAAAKAEPAVATRVPLGPRTAHEAGAPRTASAPDRAPVRSRPAAPPRPRAKAAVEAKRPRDEALVDPFAN